MAIYEYKGKQPTIGKNCYIADTADVIGNVLLGDGCYVGPGAIIRGDYGRITIGNRTGVEENVVIHARPGESATIGNDVTLGHQATIHNVLLIDDFAVIGMGSVISDYATVGRWAAIGEGAVVRNRQEIPAEAIAVGIPAKIIGSVGEDYKKEWTHFKNVYVELAKTYRNDLKKIS
ncbi:MAG: gamma carbonic anhydrase family protein [Deltaproteobacteria bacterium]|jgi:phenylacetic acid degradation protein|nr:gamma carbonic anhydrase family protein [Deltaproteobacteria bacterium]